MAIYKKSVSWFHMIMTYLWYWCFLCKQLKNTAVGDLRNFETNSQKSYLCIVLRNIFYTISKTIEQRSYMFFIPLKMLWFVVYNMFFFTLWTVMLAVNQSLIIGCSAAHSIWTGYHVHWIHTFEAPKLPCFGCYMPYVHSKKSCSLYAELKM
jgi:hypothetical protein